MVFYKQNKSKVFPFVIVGLMLAFSGNLISQTNNASIGSQKKYCLFDNKPAPIDLKGWESHSYPLGNGYFGVSFFGGVGEELWQFTEKSLHVRDLKTSIESYNHSGLSSLCELRLVQNQDFAKVTNYRRELDIQRAIGWVSYQLDGVTYTRQSITSYPDHCFAAKISASAAGKVSFRLKAIHPYLCETRTGIAEVNGNQIVLKANTLPFNLKYEVRIAVTTKGGTVKSSVTGSEGEIVVDNANEAVVYVTLGTNYRLRAESFTEKPEDKLTGCEVPSAAIEKSLTDVLKKGWANTLKSHEADIASLLGRMQLDLGGVNPNIPTRELLTATNPSPSASRYLEEVYFQYGRYLLVSSSRKGTLPATLQGTWNMLQKAPWMGGYWNNINIQMNYWPAFVTGLEETFEPYYDIYKAAIPAHLKVAKETLEKWKCQPVEGAWTLGTSLTPYRISYPSGTSGAGTGPFVLLGMWDWYRYTGNPQVLEKIWPFMLSSSKFLAGVLKEQPDGTMLCDPSYSPENQPSKEITSFPGTAYDQQLVYENFRITLEVARLLRKSDPLLPKIEALLPKLSPVLIGTSGQIKEFRQEKAYGEFGEYKHRHISHMIGLFPGTLITEKKEWLDAAKVSLTERGDKTSGWGMAHRLNAWARLKDGEHCLILINNMLQKATLPNLWDVCPPFQIDGNFGATSGIAEMLLQSHEGFIDILPALPKIWANGNYKGLVARGGFVVDVKWENSKVTKLVVKSQLGGTCLLRTPNAVKAKGKLKNSDIASAPANPYLTCYGNKAPEADANLIVFETKKGNVYLFEGAK